MSRLLHFFKPNGHSDQPSEGYILSLVTVVYLVLDVDGYCEINMLLHLSESLCGGTSQHVFLSSRRMRWLVIVMPHPTGVAWAF